MAATNWIWILSTICLLAGDVVTYNVLAFTAQTPSRRNSRSSNKAHRSNIALDASRRELLEWGIASFALFAPTASNAVVDQAESEGLLSISALAGLLRQVPTFTIVDRKGVPFMVVGEDAKVTGYFFTTYKEASRILDVARTSADKSIRQAKAEGKSNEEAGTNPWKNARISSVPLDSAVTLVSRSTSSPGGGFYFKLAPAEEDIDDALALTGKDDLAEGKCPMFYYADFLIDVDGSKRTPLYFRKSELEEEFKRVNPNDKPPPVLVTELLAVVAELVKPGGKDQDLKNLAIMAPKESEKKRKDCEKAGGKEPAFFIGQRIIVL